MSTPTGDGTAGRTRSGDGLGGHTSTADDISTGAAHGTPPIIWASVLLMTIGAVLIGAGVVALSSSTSTATWLFVAGAVVGLVGAAIGLRNKIMNNVE